MPRGRIEQRETDVNPPERLLELYLDPECHDVREAFHAELLERITRALYLEAADPRSQWLRAVLAGLEQLAERMNRADARAWKLLSPVAAAAPADHPLLAGYPRHRRLELSTMAWYLRDVLAAAIAALNDPHSELPQHDVAAAAVLAARDAEPELAAGRLSALPEARQAAALAVAFDLIFATVLTRVRPSAARAARVERWRRPIRRALLGARGGAGDVAQVLVGACLRELSHREPSRAWGARRAAERYTRKRGAETAHGVD